jgi:hypothetical protein
LRQRITSVSVLIPLTRAETGRFMDHRLQVAGYRGARLFSPEAQELIAQVSEGIPRQINNYCFHALSLACAMRKKVVDVNMIREVTHDLDIRRFVSDVGSNSHRHGFNGSNGNGDPFHPVEELTGVAREYVGPTPTADTGVKDYLSPAEAIEHMKDVARLLHNWRNGSGRPNRQSA